MHQTLSQVLQSHRQAGGAPVLHSPGRQTRVRNAFIGRDVHDGRGAVGPQRKGHQTGGDGEEGVKDKVP